MNSYMKWLNAIIHRMIKVALWNPAVYKAAYQHLLAIHIYSGDADYVCQFVHFVSNSLIIYFFEDKKREPLPPLKEIRERCIDQLEQMRPDHMRKLNPTPYKVRNLYLASNYAIVFMLNDVEYFLNKQVSVSAKLYDFIHFLWLNEAPVGELQ